MKGRHYGKDQKGELTTVEVLALLIRLWCVDDQVGNGKSSGVVARTLRDNPQGAAQIAASLQIELLDAIRKHPKLPIFRPHRYAVAGRGSWLQLTRCLPVQQPSGAGVQLSVGHNLALAVEPDSEGPRGAVAPEDQTILIRAAAHKGVKGELQVILFRKGVVADAHKGRFACRQRERKRVCLIGSRSSGAAGHLPVRLIAEIVRYQ